MSLPLIYAKLMHEVWAIDPATHRLLQESFYLHLAGRGEGGAVVAFESAKNNEPTSLVAALGASASSRNRYLSTFGDVGIVSMYGVMGKHLSGLEMACGGCSTDMVQQAFDILAHSPDIKKVVLDASSPGGQVTGIEEAANMFAALADVHGKKTYAATENQIGSAAYWIASQARNGFFATNSAIVGSVGTYLSFVDNSKEMEALGRKVEVIKSQGSDFKGMGIPGTALTEEQRTFLQASADHTNARFKKAVSSQRPKIEKDNMRGQFYRGTEAKSAGYIDATISSMAALIRRIS